MTLIEAAKQAREAFEWNFNTDLDNIPACERWAKMLKENINALDKAIAKAEQQEPVAWLPPDPPPECSTDAEKTAFAFGWFKALEAQRLSSSPPEREWQALAKELDGVIADVEEGDGFDDVCLDTVKYVRDQLAASPKREWQGLTQQDIDIAFDDTQEGGGFNEFARAIEAKLKEKNT